VPKITLWPSGETIEANETENLLIQLKKAGKDIKSSCGGCATCGDCVLVVRGGEGNLTPPTFEELRLLGNVFHITKERLSCQTRVTGEVTLDISAHEKKKRAAPTAMGQKGPTVVVRKRAELQETAGRSQEKDAAKKPDDWYRHWEKKDTEAPQTPRKLGGGKRPRPFKLNDPNDEDPPGGED
jgi:2Fe-2S ferredoxin